MCYDGQRSVNAHTYYLLKTKLTINDLEDLYEILLVGSHNGKAASDAFLAEQKRKQAQEQKRQKILGG